MKLAEAEADVFMEKFGDRAYDEAPKRLREPEYQTVLDGNWPQGHWTLVRKDHRRHEERDGLDTAIRYLER